jgi:hypothetical protein
VSKHGLIDFLYPVALKVDDKSLDISTSFLEWVFAVKQEVGMDSGLGGIGASVWKKVWSAIRDSMSQMFGWKISQSPGASSMSRAMEGEPAVGGFATQNPEEQTKRLGKIDIIISNLEARKKDAPNSLLGQKATQWIAELQNIKGTLRQGTLPGAQIADVNQRLGKIVHAIMSPDIERAKDPISHLMTEMSKKADANERATIISADDKSGFSEQIDSILGGFQDRELQRNPLYQGLFELKRFINEGNMTYADVFDAMLNLQSIIDANTAANEGRTPTI